jgi:adenosylmethionine-8-amino-7-oxononanoate aminotransferase
MQILDAEYLVQRVDEMGRPFGEKLQGLLEYPWVGDVRSLGLIGAIEFVVDKKTRAVFPRDKKFGARLTAALREHGILSRVVRGHIFALAPPFIISEAALDTLFQGVRMAIEDVCPSL